MYQNTITMRRIRIRRKNKGGGGGVGKSWPRYSNNSSRILAALCLILSVGSPLAVMAYQNDLSALSGGISSSSNSANNNRHGCVWSRADTTSSIVPSHKEIIQQGAYPPGSNPFQQQQQHHQEHNNMKSFPSLSSSSSSSESSSGGVPFYYSSSVFPSSQSTASQSSSSSGGGGVLTLNCNVRTLNTTTLFTREQIEQAKVARVRCSDKLFFESVLSSNQTLFQLKNLQEVQIDSCKIRKVPKGVFSSWAQLRKLEIHTENLQWSSSVGLEIESGAWQGLGQLESLDLSHNNIWTLFPEPNVLCPMRNLVKLNASWNRLTDVDEFGHDSVSGGVVDASPSPCAISVQNLDLSYNYLRRVTKSGFSRLRRLIELDLSSNILEEIEDAAFTGLQLQRLNLASNRLVALPPSIFTSLPNLKELSLANNSISALSPKLFSGLDQLLLLDLSRNALTSQWVRESIFGGLIRLVVLKLSYNKLTSIDLEFSDLISIQALHLNNNEIEIIQPDAFRSLSNLHILDLRNNRLTYVDGKLLSNLFVLRQLYMDNNKISEVDSEALKNCSGSLQDFGISNNLLQQITFLQNAGLGQLKTLDIGENRISFVNNQSFSGLTQLYGLRMVDNRLTELPTGFCESMKNLRVLNVGQNRISKIFPRAFSGCPELKALRLDSNLLEELSPALPPQLPSLLWFNVSQNQLKNVRMDVIPPTVEWLDLSHNELTTLIKPQKVGAIFSVRVLDASYNKLKSLDPSNIPLEKLETVRLNHNEIKTISQDMFSLAARLRRVELIGNRIEKLTLTSIRFPQIPQGRNLPEMYLGDNPFLCDCEMEWLTRVSQLAVLRQHPRIVDLDAITCRLTFPRSPNSVNVVSVTAPSSSVSPFQSSSNQAVQRLSLLSSKDFLCPYKNHCFHLCHCCEFDACDCEMSCPGNCTCYHDTPWSSNIVQCSNLAYTEIPQRIPMDATEIYLDGNEMRQLNSHIFIGKKYLKNLYLNGSSIEVIKNKTFNGLRASLEVLMLQDNLLQQIQGYEFENLDNLKELYLQNNLIRFINPNAFSSLKLRVLRLDGNRLVDFSVWELTKSNVYLNSLMLSGNPWSCDCDFIVPFKRWVSSLKNTIIVDFALAKCQPAVGEELGQLDSNNSSAIMHNMPVTTTGSTIITSQATTAAAKTTTINSMCSPLATQMNGNSGSSAAASLASDGGNANSNQAVMNNHISSMGGAARSNLLSGPYQHGHLGNYQQGFSQNNENIITAGAEEGGRGYNAGHSDSRNNDESSGISTFFACLITFIAVIIVACSAFVVAFVMRRRKRGQTGLSSKWAWCFSKCGINGGSSALPKCLSTPANSSSTNEGGMMGLGLGSGGGVGTTSGDMDYYYYSDQEKLFDAYFIYSQKDEEFVTEKLTGELERGVITTPPSLPLITQQQQHYYPPPTTGTKKLRLCLHYRDLCLAPDNPWSAEMILSACDASKRVVLVISNNFLNCEWTNNHFRSSVLSATQQHCRKLIVIKLPPVSDQSVSNICSVIEAGAEQHQLRSGVNNATTSPNNANNKQSSCTPSTTKLEWGDKNFWPKFRILLPTPQQISTTTTGNNNSNFPTISSHGRASQLPYATNLNPNGLNMNFLNGSNGSLLPPYQIPVIAANHHHHYNQPSDPLQQQHFITMMNWSGQHQQQQHQGIPTLPLVHSSSIHPAPSQLTPQHFGYSNVDGFHNNINSQQTILFSQQQQQPVHFSSSNNTRQSSRQQPHHRHHNHHHSHLHPPTGPLQQQHIHSLSQLSNMSSSKSPVEANYSSSAVSSGNEEFDHVYSTLDSPLESPLNSPCSDLGPGHVTGQFEGAIISGAQVNRHQIQHSTSSGISSGSDATSGTGGCHPGGGGNNPGGPPMYFV